MYYLLKYNSQTKSKSSAYILKGSSDVQSDIYAYFMALSE